MNIATKATPAGPGHNRPPAVDPEIIADLEPRVRAFADAAGQWLDKGAVETDEEAEKLNDLLTGLRGVAKEIETKRKASKEPHLEAGRAVDAAFSKLLDPLKKAADKVKPILTAFASKKAAAERERQREAAEEAERKAREAAEAKAAADARNDVMGAAEAEEAEKEAAEAAKAAERQAAEARRIGSASGGGRTAALRIVRRAKITSARQCFLHYEGREEIAALLTQMANADIRAAKGAAIAIPGIEIIEEETIA